MLKVLMSKMTMIDSLGIYASTFWHTIFAVIHQQFLVYLLLNEFHPEREITKGHILSQFETIDLLYVLQKNLLLVLPLGYNWAIGVWSMFHQQFLVYQFLNEFHPEREITKGHNWSQFEAIDLLYVPQKNLLLVLPLE